MESSGTTPRSTSFLSLSELLEYPIESLMAPEALTIVNDMPPRSLRLLKAAVDAAKREKNLQDTHETSARPVTV